MKVLTRLENKRLRIVSTNGLMKYKTIQCNCIVSNILSEI